MAKHEPISDKVGRALYGATAQERVDTIRRAVHEGVERRFIAALELPDKTRQCVTCHGEGYVLADRGPGEKVCTACGGTGLRGEPDTGA